MTLVGVRRWSVSSTMSTLHRYFSESTHRYGLCVFQAPETMAAHQRLDPPSARTLVTSTVVAVVMVVMVVVVLKVMHAGDELAVTL